MKLNDIHVWKINMTNNPVFIDRFRSNLTHDELKLANNYYHEKDKNCFLLCRGMLRQLLSCYTNIPVDEVCIQTNEFGKPYIDNNINDVSIQFNVSRSHMLILFAFALQGNVGIDIEYHKYKSDLDEMAKSVFSDQELRLFNGAKPEEKINLFYKLWTYKESVIKALGKGFSFDTKKFTVDDTQPSVKVIFHDKDSNIIPYHWTIKNLNSDEDYSVSLATTSDVSHIKCFHFEIK